METVMPPLPQSSDSQARQPLQLERRLFRPGLRIAVAVSGGADSVALLRALVAERERLGLVVSAAHLHHGIRGEEADQDAEFVADLARRFDLPLHLHRVDTPGYAEANGESMEEAARHLRYAWFQSLLAVGELDAVATAHTLDDQAETVLHRLLRGAWTEGLGGIHPAIGSNSAASPLPRSGSGRAEGGLILRPFLAVRRVEVENWLRGLGQPWREDSTNQDLDFTRNRLRHQLLPELAAYNPQIHTQLSHVATLARDEEAYWQAELERLLPSLLLPGKPVRGGGRAVATHPGETSVAVEIERLRGLHPAMRRRVLRAAAKRLGCNLEFEQTERLMAMCETRGAIPSQELPKTQQLAAGLRAERTPRELRLSQVTAQENTPLPDYQLSIPGEITAPGFGLRLRASLDGASPTSLPNACLRAGRAGDRVRLRYSRGPKKVKEVLERMGIPAGDRDGWPVVEWQNRIVWMQGAELEPVSESGFRLTIINEPYSAREE